MVGEPVVFAHAAKNPKLYGNEIVAPVVLPCAEYPFDPPEEVFSSMLIFAVVAPVNRMIAEARQNTFAAED